MNIFITSGKRVASVRVREKNAPFNITASSSPLSLSSSSAPASVDHTDNYADIPFYYLTTKQFLSF